MIKANDVLMIGRGVISRLTIRLDDTTRAGAVAREIAEEFDAIPYINTWSTSFDETIYLRVNKIIPSPTKEGSPLLVGTTFPISTGVVRLVVAELIEEKYEVVTDEQKVLAIARGQVEVLNPSSGPLGTLEAVVSAVFPPERWQFMTGAENSATPAGLYIHFPEVHMTNSKNQKHTIYDLFVRIPMTANGREITGSIEGRRMTISPSEVLAGYRHSHLRPMELRFSPFCLGDTHNADMVQDMIGGGIKEDQFFLFLHQLEPYVAWESLEGGPYNRMEGLGGGARSLQNSARRPSFQNPTPEYIRDCAWRVMGAMVPTDLSLLQNPDGSEKWLVNITGTAGTRMRTLIEAHYQGTRYPYDTNRGEYQILRDDRGESSYEDLKRQFLSSQAFTFRGTVYRPRVIGDNPTDEVVSSVIRIPQPAVYVRVVEQINFALNANF